MFPLKVQQAKKAAFAYYQKLPSRERVIALSIAGLSILLLIYTALLGPTLSFSRNARLTLDNERAAIDFIQQHADQIRQINAARQAKTGQDTTLLTLASKTAGEHKLILQRYEPTADGKLGLWLSETEFNTLLIWIDQLVHQYDIQINRINITQSTKPGLVEVQLTLQQ